MTSAYRFLLMIRRPPRSTLTTARPFAASIWISSAPTSSSNASTPLHIIPGRNGSSKDFHTVPTQFETALDFQPARCLDELNRRSWAWVLADYHPRRLEWSKETLVPAAVREVGTSDECRAKVVSTKVSVESCSLECGVAQPACRHHHHPAPLFQATAAPWQEVPRAGEALDR